MRKYNLIPLTKRKFTYNGIDYKIVHDFIDLNNLDAHITRYPGGTTYYNSELNSNGAYLANECYKIINENPIEFEHCYTYNYAKEEDRISSLNIEYTLRNAIIREINMKIILEKGEL